MHLRPYHPTDLPALYRICLLTGDVGQDATALYADAELLGHIYAGPYAVLEPDLCFVLTDAGRPCGYILGARDTAAFGRRLEHDWFPPLRERYPLLPTEDHSPEADLRRLLHTSQRGLSIEENAYPAHLHIDLLPEAQGQGWGRRLMEAYLKRLRELNVRGVHLGVDARNLNAQAFYARLGFQVLRAERWGKVMGRQVG